MNVAHAVRQSFVSGTDGEDVAGYSWKLVAQSSLGIYNKVKGVENDAR